MSVGVEIRVAVAADARTLLEIYAPYIRDTAITFERDVPSEAEFADRITKTLARYPYLVAQHAGEPVGYAYASPLKGRSAYDWSVELSVYVARDSRGLGIGRALYEALEAELRTMGVTGLYACIATPDEEDEFLTFDSVRFHERMGFSHAGTLRHCANKFGRWYNATWMEKAIGDREASPSLVVWFPEARRLASS